jgi:FKBP-type peptidyl-prolyl cis-trans isomerase FkpA
MKLITSCLFLAGMFGLFSSCNNVQYRKTGGGMPYKIFRAGGGEEVKKSRHVKINLIQKINDSIYFTSQGKLPLYLFVPAEPRPYDLTELWHIARVGDSLVSIQMIDTFMKKFPDAMPPQVKRGDRLISFIKVLGVFDSDSARMADEALESKKLLAAESAAIEKYLSEKNIKAQKTPSGAFVEILQPGTGNLIDSGNYVMVKYKGYTFEGVVFDTNKDSTFGHTDPLSFTVGHGAMIPGFEEGLKFLRKGAEARFYIPSMLAYGPRPTSDKIKQFENIIFDITVTDVREKAP